MTHRLTLAAAMILIGCQARAQLAPNRNSANRTSLTRTAVAADPTTELRARIAQQGSVTFRSSDGKRLGLGGDNDLVLLPKGVAHIFSYGGRANRFDGTYTIGSGGKIFMQFALFRPTRFSVSLKRDAASLFVVPTDKNERMSWPLRSLSPSAEARFQKERKQYQRWLDAIQKSKQRRLRKER